MSPESRYIYKLIAPPTPSQGNNGSQKSNLHPQGGRSNITGYSTAVTSWLRKQGKAKLNNHFGVNMCDIKFQCILLSLGCEQILYYINSKPDKIGLSSLNLTKRKDFLCIFILFCLNLKYLRQS